MVGYLSFMNWYVSSLASPVSLMRYGPGASMDTSSLSLPTLEGYCLMILPAGSRMLIVLTSACKLSN